MAARLFHKGNRSAVFHIEAILDADAEFARDIDAGFIGKYHAVLQDLFPFRRKHGIFVDLKPDAVAQRVREVLRKPLSAQIAF